MTNLRSEIVPYLCYNGKMVSHTTVNGNPDPDGNALITTGIYYFLLGYYDELTQQDIQDWEEVLKQCEISPGVYKRNPVKSDQQGPDDYVVLTMINSFLSTSKARDVVNHGINNCPKLLGFKLKYFYNTEMPNTMYHGKWDKPRKWYQKALDLLSKAPEGQEFNDSAWLGRQIQLRAHFQFAALQSPGFFARLAWAYSIYKATKASKTDQDAWLLSWCLIKTVKSKSNKFYNWLIVKPSNLWYKKREELFGEKIGDFSSLFTSVLEAGHPLGKYFKL